MTDHTEPPAAPVFDRERDGRIAITGGAGFIGANLADRMMREGHDVVILDSYARPGAEQNAHWLAEQHGMKLRIRRGDIRDRMFVHTSLRDASVVFHLAAQPALTTSITQPRLDFETNALGTFNVLEALRQMDDPPPLLFASTSKIYGDLPTLSLSVRRGRYEPDAPALRERGIDESQPLDFVSPYSCSKGAADQYVLDYARLYGLPNTVFRMGCVYGPRQLGNADQGWIAHLLHQGMRREPVTIHGDGQQVRDVLFVDDLADAAIAAWRTPAARGHAFNIGGGPERTLTPNELLAMVDALEGALVTPRFEPWRPGDPRWYASDTAAFRSATGWQPRVGVDEGVRRLHDWLGSSVDDDVAVDREWP